VHALRQDTTIRNYQLLKFLHSSASKCNGN